MGQIPNNFTILNRDYNTQRYNLNKKKKKNSHLLFTHCSFPHCISLTIFFCSLYFLFYFACSHSHGSSRLHCPQSHSLELLFTLLFPFFLLCTKWQMAEQPHFISSSFPSGSSRNFFQGVPQEAKIMQSNKKKILYIDDNNNNNKKYMQIHKVLQHKACGVQLWLLLVLLNKDGRR